MPNSYVRRRAGLVCVQCHARKIKCDLQQRQPGSCLNCMKTNLECRKRRGLRRGAQNKQPAEKVNPNSQLAELREIQVDRQLPPESCERFVGYLAEESFLSNTCGPDIDDVEVSMLQEQDPPTLRSALSLAPRPILDAFIDFYFTNMFPLVPVVDRLDVTEPGSSALLIQCLCMLGSHYRHPQLPSMPTAESFYCKAKTLMNCNYEKDSLTVLKALCLICCRSKESPTIVSLDSSWHWLGVATRYAFNMGLHLEVTYQGRAAAGLSRRIWWNIFNQDKLQSLCYGRPPGIRLHEVNVELPTLQDFSIPHPDNEVFLQRTKICIILGKLSDAQHGRYQSSILEEATHIGEYLKKWINELPRHLQLYTPDLPPTRSPYRRDASELHIMYFTCIILFYRLIESPHLGLTSLKVSMVAASCTLQLLKEIYYRNEIPRLLPINNWYCMVAGVPLVHAMVKLPENAALHHEELDMLRLILHEMTHTSPSTQLIINNIDRLHRSVLSTPDDELISRPSLGSNNLASSETRDPIFWAQFRPVEPLQLFPFPPEMSPRMNLLQSLAQDCKYSDVITVEAESLQGEEQETRDGTPQFSFNFDFGNIQVDEFLFEVPEADILPFGPSVLS